MYLLVVVLHYWFIDDTFSQLKKPSIRSEEKTLYYQSPPSLEEQTRPNLLKRLGELVSNGEEVAITDPAFPTVQFKYKLVFKD
jgi:ubiquitin-activating enzyme E1 C